MFDVVVASSPHTVFAERIATTLRSARLRVISCELGPADRPPSVFRVDAAVACADSVAAVGGLAINLRAALEGPPPVVGVTRGASSPPPGTVDVIGEDSPGTLIVARVQRAAAGNERRRARIVLAGDLADVGARSLLASLAARRRTCVVKVKAGTKRAEISLGDGQVIHARADGVAASSADAVLSALTGWADASFEVHGGVEPAPDSRDGERPTLRPSLGGDAADVALAAAVMNAVASYARAFMPSETVVRHLDESRAIARRIDPGIDAFTISREGMVSVTRMSLAQTALPGALAAWCLAFFDACASAMPARFRKDRIGDVLGGLTRLIEQVGWGAALLPSEEVA